MKNSKLWTILCIVVLVLQVVAEALTAAIILRLNVLPDKYTVVLAAVLGLLGLITGLLLFAHGKKTVGTVRRVIACILALLIVSGCALISKVAADAYQTIHAVTNGETTNARNMYVFVRVDDPAQSLADTADYPYAIVGDYDVEHTERAIALVEEYTGEALAITQHTKFSEVADALYAGQADAVILNGASVVLLMEDEAYADFTEKARILYTVPLTQLEDPEPSTQPEQTDPPAVKKTVTNAPFIVYISGSDTRSASLNVSRSDVNILMVVNPVTKQVLLLNTPRDYYVPNPAGNGKLDKLTHCGLYGTDCSIEALEGLYELEVDYYAQINFTGFETLIDAIGGITVYSDQAFTARETYIQKGENYLTGTEALDFARERYHVSGGDNGRGKNQMKVIQAVIEKATTGTTIISNYSGILSSLEGMFKTSLSMDDISQLVKMQLSDMASWNVKSFAVTGTGGSEKTYSAPGDYAYVMYPDEDVVAYAGELVERVIAGEILTQEDITLPK